MSMFKLNDVLSCLISWGVASLFKIRGRRGGGGCWPAGGAGKARFNVATPTYEARTRPLHVQHTYYRIIFKQNPFNIISRGVQGCTSTDFRLK